jgi:hypothetical protein
MAIISSIGLFWERDNVFWGTQKNPGKLLGIPRTSKKSTPVDFRDQIGIYILYADFDPVYVGQAGKNKNDQRLFIRLRNHLTDDLEGRWNKFSWFGLLGVNKVGNKLQKPSDAFQRTNLSDGLDQLEGILINAMEPSLNSQNGRFGDSVVKYIQIRDERLGKTQEEMIKEIHQILITK